MKLLIMGPPGAGKGTLATMINKYYNIPHISSGDMFREIMAKQTKVGLLAKEYIDRGELAPDDVTIELMKERLDQDDVVNGFLLDGFPRTIVQAVALDKMLETEHKELDYVINLVVSDDILVKRISGRRVCPNCGAIYHLDNIKPKVEGICDYCGTKLIQRDDDRTETVEHRIEVYYKQTRPLIDFYEKSGILRNVDGSIDYRTTFDHVKKIIGEAK